VPRFDTPEERDVRAAQQRQKEAEKKAAFLEDYRHFASFGWPDEKIAKHFGCSFDALRLRLKRLGVPIRLDLDERKFVDYLNKLIDSRRPFTAESMPEGADPNFERMQFRKAAKEGRLMALGKKRTGNGVNTIWIGTEEAASA
jgi:hypothetical protein